MHDWKPYSRNPRDRKLYNDGKETIHELKNCLLETFENDTTKPSAVPAWKWLRPSLMLSRQGSVKCQAAVKDPELARAEGLIVLSYLQRRGAKNVLSPVLLRHSLAFAAPSVADVSEWYLYNSIIISLSFFYLLTAGSRLLCRVILLCALSS